MLPRLVIYKDRILENTKRIVGLTRKAGISLVGVTKAVCANIQVAQAMLGGGVAGLADSRLENLKHLREHLGSEVSLLLLRQPMLSQAGEVVEVADISLNSELVVMEALNTEAQSRNKQHGVILMVDLGDLREGLWPDRVLETAQAVENLSHLTLEGLGTNLTCFGGILPTQENLGQLVHLVRTVSNEIGRKLSFASGGNSSSLHLLNENKIPPGINHLRVGETILIGNDTALNKPFPGTRWDAFILQAELVEVKVKPSVPLGTVGRDAFGRIPKKPVDKGLRKRGILAVGEQDIHPGGLKPLAGGIEILGASSDYLLVDITKAAQELKVGDRLDFGVDYGNLLRSMTSPYVAKVIQ